MDLKQGTDLELQKLPRGALRIGALQGAIGVSAAQLFAAEGGAAGAIALACLALGAAASALKRRAQEWVVTALAAHVVLGMAAGLYERSVLYDKLVHLALSFGLARLVAGALAQQAPRWAGVLAVLGLGALWELFEFAADATGLVVAQRGLADTMLDLGADAAGALLGGISARILGTPTLWLAASLGEPQQDYRCRVRRRQ